MKRRLTLAILGSVFAALLLAGVGTLLLGQLDAARRTEAELRQQATATAQLVQTAISGYARLGDAETRALVDQVCGSDIAADGDAAAAARQTIRAALCTGGITDLASASIRLCSETWDPLSEAVAGDVEQTRRDFCANPDAAALETFRQRLCDAPVILANPGARREFVAAREALCRSIRRQTIQRSQLTQTLSDESIGLLVVEPDGALSSGSMPDGLMVDDVDPAALRAGATTSGRLDESVWAAAPVADDAPSVAGGDAAVAAVVITRQVSFLPSSLPWFLIAAAATILIGAFVAARLSRRLTAPLRAATAATGRIAGGDLATRLDAGPDGGSHDELGLLARSINEMAENLERAKGLEEDFLLSITHDLRTPLTSIQGYAEAIADGATTDAAAAASIILTESRRLDRLVGDLLDLAKLEARAFSFREEPVDLCEVAGDVADGFHRSFEEAGLELELDTPDTEVWATADPDRVAQVITNLVENARKYATRRVTIAVRHSTSGPSLQVHDDGTGIAAADLPYVFDRLYVTGHRPRRSETGSGLGLAIVRDLTEAMGGQVAADAPDTAGTRIIVTLRPGEPEPTAAS